MKVELYAVRILLDNNRTLVRVAGGWSVEDAGQRSVVNGKWVDRKEAHRSGKVVTPDVFPTLEDAITAALVI